MSKQPTYNLQVTGVRIPLDSIEEDPTQWICEKLGIEISVSTYTTRHSFATQLMRHGAPTEFISKQLGHSNIETTTSYLENFEERQLKEWQARVTDFEI